MALVLLLAGCAGVPSQEMSDARRALGAAHEASAERHAPAAMSRASDAMDGATQALRGGDYDGARRLAGVARTQAIAARQLATRVSEIRSLIDTERSAGRPWEGAEGLLRRALDASREGDVARALEIAERARTLLP
jgi:hypothetical protein